MTEHRPISAETYRRIIDGLLDSLEQILEDHQIRAAEAKEAGLDTTFIEMQNEPYIKVYSRIVQDLQEAQAEADQAGVIEA